MSKEARRFDPDDPFPPYPASEKRKSIEDFPVDVACHESASDAHPEFYPGEADEREAFENGYMQAYEDILNFVGED